MMLMIPTSYISYQLYQRYLKKYFDDAKGAGGQYTLGYAPTDPVNRFVKPQLSYWDRFRIYVASVIHSLLTDPSVEKEALNFLDKSFRHPQT